MDRPNFSPSSVSDTTLHLMQIVHLLTGCATLQKIGGQRKCNDYLSIYFVSSRMCFMRLTVSQQRNSVSLSSVVDITDSSFKTSADSLAKRNRSSKRRMVVGCAKQCFHLVEVDQSGPFPSNILTEVVLGSSKTNFLLHENTFLQFFHSVIYRDFDQLRCQIRS